MFTILIVEDHLFFRKSLEEMLHKRYPTLNVKGARDGPEALRMINAAMPDTFVMVDKIPKTSVGKIDKKMIKKRVAEGAA
jgi:non-ribosomal peptide synthetase component E (peptide arylation enzyme)